MSQSTPEEVKNAFIDYYDDHYGLGFFEDVSYENITEYSMLDPAAIEADGGFEAFAYFDTNLDSFFGRVEKDEIRKSNMENLKARLASDETLRNAVDALFDMELAQTSVAPELWKGAKIISKVTTFSFRTPLIDRFIGAVPSFTSCGQGNQATASTSRLQHKPEKIRVRIEISCIALWIRQYHRQHNSLHRL